jgi:hypothetical protein
MKKGLIMLVVLSTFSSCMVVGRLAGGKTTTSEKEFILNSKGTISQDKKNLKQVLYKQGYMKLSEKGNVIQFQKKSPLLSEIVISKTKTVIITAQFFENEIKLEIVQNGNFKVGQSEKVGKTFLVIKNDYEENN